MELFANEQEANRESCLQMIEQEIAELGHDLASARVPPSGSDRAWWIQKGSAFVQIRLRTGRKENFLKVSSPVLVMDGKVDRAHLYQRLLELNADAIYGAAFAVQGTRVILTAERSTRDLDRSEVRDLIRRVSEYADHYDDKLVAEFGGGLPTRPG